MKRVGCNRVSPVFPNRGKIYGPLVKWLRHGPFTAVTWVRVPYGSPHRQSVRGLPTIGGLAQLVRAPASHAGGHWFESSSLHQKVPDFARNQELFLFILLNSDAAFWRFSLDPNRDPKAERSGKHRRGADGIIRPSPAVFCGLHGLADDAADGVGGGALHPLRGVGVGAEGKARVIVSQRTGQRLDVHAVLEGQRGEGVPLRYNNDKRKKPLFSRGLSVCRHLFNSFSKLKCDEKIIEKRRLFH